MKKNSTCIGRSFFIGLLFLIIVLGVNTKEASAINVTYDTATEENYTERYNTIVNDRVAGSPLECEDREDVDYSTGKLSIVRTDLVLKGMAGMNLELSRYYDSKKAGIGKAMAEAVDKLDISTLKVYFSTGDKKEHYLVVSTAIYNNHPDVFSDMYLEKTKEGDSIHTAISTQTQRTKLTDSYNTNAYGISTGWAFDFPWIETMTLKDDIEGYPERPLYLHMGSAGTMKISTSANADNQTFSILGFEDYKYQDIKLEIIHQNVDGVQCGYLLRDKTGMRTYFNENGVIVLKKDPHNNTIRFTYKDAMHFDTITDSVGRKIQFHYEPSKHGMLFLKMVTVEGEKVEGGVSRKTVRYQMEETSYQSIRGNKMYGSKLINSTVDGIKESYDYRTVESLVTTAGNGIASQRAMTNQTYLLQGISSCGSIEKYEYHSGGVRAFSGEKRNVTTQQFYVTREYEQDQKSKKKANGIKYDYYQERGGNLYSYADLSDEKNEIYAYGTDQIQNLTIVSSYNPNKTGKHTKYVDYTYKKSDIDIESLQLKKKPKRKTRLYVFNTNRLLLQETEEEEAKVLTEYSYDQSGTGSLVLYQTEKNYGTKRTGRAKTSKEGFTYDEYRNLLTEKSPKAFKEKYKGKEQLFTTTYTYHGNGYPSDDIPYILSQPKTEVAYISTGVISKTEYSFAENKLDVSRTCEYININGAGYRLTTQLEEKYDKKGNQIEHKIYPSCGNGEMGDVIIQNYYYNSLGQNIKETVKKVSARHPEQNESYIEKESSFDSFGNEVSNKDRKGVFSTYTYNEDTNEEMGSVYAKGTAYETSDEACHTEDHLKTMSLDYYNRCTVTQSDSFGNTIISKDEKNGTWTESDYDYGDGQDVTEDEESEDIEEAVMEPHLIEERTYAFEPTGDKVTIREDGTKEYNYDIAGKGKEILSGSRHTYNDEDEEVVTAEFSGGAMDSAHCSSWTVSREEEEVDDKENTITTSYVKELDPNGYTEYVDKQNYYNQYNNYVLTETVNTSITDEEGNITSETMITTSGDSQQIEETTSTYDDFGKVVTQTVTNQGSEHGKLKNKSETETSYEYNYQGNIIKMTVKSRKDVDQPWNITTTRATYNDQGQLVESYDARGVREGYAVKYEYDLSGQIIKESIPVEKKDGKIIYQVNTKEYDKYGNVVAEESEQGDGKAMRTEYTYDMADQLIMVKSVEREDKAIYAQYLYDREGNKIRQYTGMTKPLTLTLEKGVGANVYCYMDVDYHVEISGQAKSDIISETKYEYNKRDDLVSETDPEGNIQRYVYDVYGNLRKIIDKNGNVTEQKYDYQNRLEEESATDKETGKTIKHTYEYDHYGDTTKIDNHRFTYDRISGQIASETCKAGKKTWEKNYRYDSEGAATHFEVKVGSETALSYIYEYDGESRLKKVIQDDGGKNETIASYEYDANGVLIKENGQKVETNYNYNLNNMLSQMTNKTHDGVLLSQYQAVYSKAGQKLEESEEIRGIDGITKKKTSRYRYDLLGRLTEESHTGAEDIFYTYDAHNNRAEMRTASNTVSYRYNKNEELQRTNTLNHKTEEVGVTLYRYDRNGNQLATIKRRKIERTKTGPQFDLNVSIGQNQLNDNVVSHYDAMNQQEDVLTKNYKVTYTYNAEGLRDSKCVNGEKSIYVWDGDQLVLELNKDGRVTKRYVRGHNLSYTDSGKGTERQYYVKDSHGSVVQLINQNGSIAKQYAYDSFGNEEKPDKKDDNAFRFCGEYYDKETDTLYLRARNYAAGLGRFTTRDTYTGEENRISTLNLYTYCENDGVNRVDPTGHWGKDGKHFVHQDLTKEAVKALNANRKKYWKKTTKKYKNLLDGSILPDFVNEKISRDGKRIEELEKSVKKKYGKSKRYKMSYFNKYLKYKKSTLLGYRLRGSKVIQSRFHGKDCYMLTKLKNNTRAKVKKNRKKEERFLLVGCVLHSIQDYSAHSFVSDLADYKRDAEVYLNGKTSYLYDKENAYHSDWRFNKDGELVPVAGEHRKNKDNPNRVLRKVRAFNNGRFLYEWKTVKNRNDNERYVQARNDTKEYLTDIISYLK